MLRIKRKGTLIAEGDKVRVPGFARAHTKFGDFGRPGQLPKFGDFV